MNIELTKSFIKDFKKLDSKIKEAFIKRKALFLKDPFHPILNNHSLKREYSNFRSINITGDFRAIYYTEKNNTTYFFVRISTHSELY